MIHATLIKFSAEMLKNTNFSSLFRFQVGVLFFSTSSQRRGIRRELKSQIHLFISCTERGKQGFFLFVTAKQTLKLWFSVLCWGAFGDVWDGLATFQVLTLLALLVLYKSITANILTQHIGSVQFI